MANDPFPVIERPSVVGVRDIKYEVFDPDPDGSETQAMTFEAQIVWSDGSVTTKGGNVAPHLTAAEISGLQSLVLRLRGKAEAVWGNAE